MLGIPDRYRRESELPKKDFIKRATMLTASERKKFSSAVTNLRLKYIIAGAEIPPLINNHYNSRVLQCLEVNLTDIRQRQFCGEILQRQIKEHAIVKFVTIQRESAYCFARKRLNQNDNEQTVADYITHSPVFTASILCSDLQAVFEKHIIFDKILNHAHIPAFNFEILLKTEIITQAGIIPHANGLLQAKYYYDYDSMLTVAGLIAEIKATEKQKTKELTTAGKARLNSNLKKIYTKLQFVTKMEEA
ncbi:MAG: DUF4391 domain-containing protein [Bacillota bacterium]